MTQVDFDVPENAIPPDLLEFIARHIESVEQLEILCLLAENPSRGWLVQEVLRCVQSTEKSVEQCLQAFAACELAVKNVEGAFRFSSTTSQLTNAATKLVRAYRERRVAIIEMIYKGRDGAQHLAEAVRLRKDQ